jgi:hypothetical protein
MKYALPQNPKFPGEYILAYSFSKSNKNSVLHKKMSLYVPDHYNPAADKGGERDSFPAYLQG